MRGGFLALESFAYFEISDQKFFLFCILKTFFGGLIKYAWVHRAHPEVIQECNFHFRS
jgi:hypothetical protein